MTFPIIVEIRDRFEDDSLYSRVICSSELEVRTLTELAEKKGLMWTKHKPDTLEGATRFLRQL